MSGGRRYLEVDDQPALVAKMDLDAAREQCRSFDKLVRDLRGLVERLPTSPT
jgi:hypothetical protein